MKTTFLVEMSCSETGSTALKTFAERPTLEAILQAAESWANTRRTADYRGTIHVRWKLFAATETQLCESELAVGAPLVQLKGDGWYNDFRMDDRAPQEQLKGD